MPRIARATVVGCGPSSGVPVAKCLVGAQYGEPACPRCIDGVKNPQGDNDRLNPSLLLTIEGAGADSKTVLIDAGKTARNMILKYFVPNGIRRLDELIITHAHSDAYLGIEDLAPLIAPHGHGPIKMHTDKPTIATVARVFPNAIGTLVMPHEVTPGAIFEVGGGLQIHSVYVDHGVDCLAFIISLEPSGKLSENCETLVYLSDLGRMPDDARATILKYGRPKIVLIDLLRNDHYDTHYGKKECMAEAERLGGEETIFIGTSHSLDRDRHMAEMTEAGKKSYRYARDGLDVFVAAAASAAAAAADAKKDGADSE